MSGRGLQNIYSEPKYLLFGMYLHVLILGLLFLLCMPIFTHIQVSAENCKSKNISAKYQHCGIHPDGVRNLDCFSKYKRDPNCTWEPGKHQRKSEKFYTLIFQQPAKPHCKVFYNLTKLYQSIRIFGDYNLTVEVFENTEKSNCTRAVFRGSPKSLYRCDPPNSVLPTRSPGALKVDLTWNSLDAKYISKFSVRYKMLGSHSWNKAVESQSPTTVSVEKLNPSLIYVVQIQCVTSVKCSQCPWSKNYIVPSVLMAQPIITSSKYTDIPGKTGSRLISITWKFPVKELCDGYKVMIRKESGEVPEEQMNTSKPEIKLILSYSAYHLKIFAYNNVSHSPAVSHIIPQHGDVRKNNLGDGRLNVTVHNSIAFTVSWSNLIGMYVCYSVEWMTKGHSAWYRSFFEDTKNNQTLSSLSEPLEPYKRYRITLHVRPNKNTCNLKHINNSEITYGSTEFYYMEGSPVSAPANISFHNVTVNSAVLKWSQIPEEDLRGFLLGYIIHYTEYHYRETSTVHNITVDPDFSSFNIESLKSGTAYQVQISGFTSAGEGNRSAPSVFKTNHKVNFSIGGPIAVFLVVACVLTFGSPLIKRVRAKLWPSIPNPGDSNAVQKIESPCQLELIEALATLKVEEWDTNSFQILEKEAVIPSHTLPSMLPLLSTFKENSPEMNYTWSEGDTDRATETEDNLYEDTVDTIMETQTTQMQSSPLAFPGGYTTMEMFQQLVPQGNAADTSNRLRCIERTPVDLIMLKSVRLDYVRQFSTSPPSESEHMSIIL